MEEQMREIDQAVQQLNPVQDGAPADTAKLEAILATPRSARSEVSPRSRKWWFVAAVAVATAAAVTYNVADPFGSSTQPALAATPPPLAYSPGGPTAAHVLKGLASRVEKLSDDRPTAWKTEHFVWNSWSLSTRIDGSNVTSAVIPEHRETWQRRDGSAEWKTRTLKPVFQNKTQRTAWEKDGSIGAEPIRSHDSSGPASQLEAAEPPSTVDGMKKWLAGGRAELKPGLLYEVVPERVQDHVFSPSQRAALLRVLAETGWVRYSGAVTDRAGRTGEAFSLTDRSGGLPSKRTLIFDPSTGKLLADEEQILQDPGKLNVAPNSVIGYTTFLTTERLT
ncbi:CU044_5270 family protein [Streptomyces sp. NPDC102340]|uniref:CU044_5270 family protein n=1 Tax=unclassified Streptomyces TaxID=2593676 RepID=UPI0038044E0D